MFVKKLIVMFLFCGSVSAAPVIFTLGDMKTAVRLEAQVRNISDLPDSTLETFCNRSLLWTSVDIGGKEGQIILVTIAEQGFYAIADSITEIVHATLVTNNKTYTIKAWYPEFFLDKWPDDEGRKYISSGPADETPIVYNYWADTLQLIPVPQKVDSIYLKVWLEHIIKDTADVNPVQLRPAYTEAAVNYAIYLVFRRARLFEEATFYLSRYKELKVDLKTVYTRKFDATR